MKRCRILREKRGFTLIEIIVGMTVSTILLLSIAVVVSTFYLNYINSIELSYSRVMANNIADAVKDQLVTARVTGCSADSITYVTEFGEKTIEGGENPTIEGLTYDEDYYMKKTVNLTFADEGEGVYTVTVSVRSGAGSNREPYVLERSFKLLNPPA